MQIQRKSYSWENFVSCATNQGVGENHFRYFVSITLKMRTIFFYILFFYSLLSVSFVEAQLYGVPVKKPENILKDRPSFLNYRYTTLRLSDDFIALDTNDVVIPKGDFLEKIITGEYLPLRLNSKKRAYRLFKIKGIVDHYIPSILRDIGVEELNNYKWEGKPLPAINFRDLNGNLYNKTTIKGKILVLNLWFVHCTNCVAEMPELNKLVDQYKNRKDICFLSFALDKEEDLKKFLKKTTFNYKVISDTAWYLYKPLGIRGFPSQILIDKEGAIVKIFSNFYSLQRLIPALKMEALK